MNQIIEFKVLPKYHIWIKFSDGIEKEVGFQPFIGKGISKELLDHEFFKKVKIENGGGLIWPNGFDVCPNFLKDYESNAKQDLLSV